ncbi:ATP-dependent RNA helicase DRS1 [Babesia sp. Xinjiang]|uniref:ATP-dependent RNA helicase DRS1 n=1 Tax=Babesia sp. Xinjiang TaxID=462227 RepID=UPI000A25CB38|nr:ATP-dependent RNA helicase DRS1 [Babesia sp. Xinjiang]ORM39961.1 ATP-dependent RNA helicase DRS1 [Babesia sp. Xinjiang]
MKNQNISDSISDDDQDISIELQDGFFDLLVDSDADKTPRREDNAKASKRPRGIVEDNASQRGKDKASETKEEETSIDGKRAGQDPKQRRPRNRNLEGTVGTQDKTAVNLQKTDIDTTIALKEERKNKSDLCKHLTSDASWSDYGLSRSLIKVTLFYRQLAYCSKAVFDMGYEAPSIIQSKVIPVALEGKDLLATAETGSGKSAAFLVPTLQRLINAGVIRQKDAPYIPGRAQRVGTKALILLPTRELAAQCYDVFLALTQYLNQNGVLLTGGVPVKEQEAKLRRMPYIVFATPGKVLDIMLNSNSIHMDAIEIVVLDEADRLLDLGFKDELAQILKLCNKERQTMLFSATLTEATKDIVPVALVNPIYIKAAARITVAKTLKCEMIQLPNDELREAAALYLCSKRYSSRTILFFQTKRAAHRATLVFQLAGLKCGELHGDLSQSKRFEQVEKFKNGEVDFLMASELASRGLDIPGVMAVINVHLPTDTVRFVHRVGRTARMGEKGTAITFYVEKERSAAKSMIKSITEKGSSLEKQKIKLSTAALKNYKQKIDEMEQKIKEVLAGEQVEKEMRRCENVIKRGSDPQKEEERVWFRSKKEKKAASKNEFIQTKIKAGCDSESIKTNDTQMQLQKKKSSTNAKKPVKKMLMTKTDARNKNASGGRNMKSKKRSQRSHT